MVPKKHLSTPGWLTTPRPGPSSPAAPRASCKATASTGCCWNGTSPSAGTATAPKAATHLLNLYCVHHREITSRGAKFGRLQHFADLFWLSALHNAHAHIYDGVSCEEMGWNYFCRFVFAVLLYNTVQRLVNLARGRGCFGGLFILFVNMHIYE